MNRRRAAALTALSIALVAGTPTAPRALAADPAATTTAPNPATGPAATTDGMPKLAYYYIWFTPASWDRAKRDYPQLGRYSSDDTRVMRQHIQWAKRAGITGFIVSWKHTPTLDRRLAKLIDVAESEHFTLAMIYQGLDFYRRPVPAEQVGADLKFFAKTFANRAPFRIFAKPLVIWSGTWEFAADAIGTMTEPVRDSLLVLASEKNVAGYERLAGAVDGNAYYWSSVNTDTYKRYPEKLAAMSDAVHSHAGLWIAPAAAGFDARMIGGTTTVDRKNGATLLRQCKAALASDPDALGIISWNEFSENSHIEPSKNFGDQYLDAALACTSLDTGAVIPPATGVDVNRDGLDSSSSSTRKGTRSGVAVIVGFGVLSLGAVAVVLRRSARRKTDTSVS